MQSLIQQLNNPKWPRPANSTAPALPCLASNLSCPVPSYPMIMIFHQVLNGPCQVNFIVKVTFSLANQPNQSDWKEFIIQGDWLNHSKWSRSCQASCMVFFHPR